MNKRNLTEELLYTNYVDMENGDDVESIDYRFARLEVERCVTTDEMPEVVQWILKYGIEAEQLND